MKLVMRSFIDTVASTVLACRYHRQTSHRRIVLSFLGLLAVVPSGCDATRPAEPTLEEVQTGAIEVRAVTTGATDDLDRNGYTITIDDRAAVGVGPNYASTITNLPVGLRTVRLGDVAGNCEVTSPNPTTVVVARGSAAATLAFSVSCAPRSDPCSWWGWYYYYDQCSMIRETRNGNVTYSRPVYNHRSLRGSAS